MDIWEFEKQWVDDFGVGYKTVEQVCRNVARDVCCAWRLQGEEDDIFMFCQQEFLRMYNKLVSIYIPEKGDFVNLLYVVLRRKAHTELTKWLTKSGTTMLKKVEEYEVADEETPEYVLQEFEIRDRIVGGDKIKEIIVSLLRPNITMQAIAQELNELGYKTQSGQAWTKQRVSEIVAAIRADYPQIENILE